jgi:outer membrane protein TolC
VTRSPIVLARLDRDISVASFKSRLMDTLLDVERTYWDLVVAQRRVTAVREALEAAEENLRIARLRHEAGKDKRLIVSLAESAVTSRQADLIAARLELATTSDRLKRLLNDTELPLDDPALIEAAEGPIVHPMRVDRAVHQQSMLTALEERPEIVEANARLAQLGLLERVARNDRLPRFDLAAAYGMTGLHGKNAEALRQQFGTEFFEWSVGIEVEVPIGNRARAAAHRRAQLEEQRTVKEREDTRQRILLEVSEAVRSLASAEEAVLATRAAREAAEQTLQDQQANVTAGAALVKDLLEAQRDLAEAKVREVESQAAYMTSLAALERAKGTLLAYNRIALLEELEELDE